MQSGNMSVTILPQLHRYSDLCVAVPSVSSSADRQPVRPLKPEIADCCGDGCARCVFDIYEEALARFEVDLAAWRARQPQGVGNGNLSPLKE